jgi:hypothetical protein
VWTQQEYLKIYLLSGLFQPLSNIGLVLTNRKFALFASGSSCGRFVNIETIGTDASVSNKGCTWFNSQRASNDVAEKLGCATQGDAF